MPGMDNKHTSPDTSAANVNRHPVAGWGRFPVTQARLFTPASHAALLSNTLPPDFVGIARGQGRSYGDSALADQLLQTSRLDALLALDETEGLLHCAAGVTLAVLLRLLVPRGWFLPVVPGTAQVSVGGAIASDVHGKNHHRSGCFSEHIVSFVLMDAGGQTHNCSRSENSALFHASCGGMGLTGIITSAVLKLQRITSPMIRQQTLQADDLEQTFHLITARSDSTYSVAWLDCMATGRSLGRSLLFLGEHVDADDTAVPLPGVNKPPGDKKRPAGAEQWDNRLFDMPFTTPAMLLNRYSMRTFNAAYYHMSARRSRGSEQYMPWQGFFFPLDRIGHWHRLYGRRGFLQYQFVLPETTALEGMRDILERVTAAGKGSFLSVLKRLGPANNNLLSFPMAGYTLALDFRYQPDLLPLLEELDKRVLHFGGRLYLAKDARMDKAVFRASYPDWQAFVALRESSGANTRFNSLQSQRLGL